MKYKPYPYHSVAKVKGEAVDLGDRGTLFALLDSSDAAFADLRVWQDANGDAVTDAGELQTLAAVKSQPLIQTARLLRARSWKAIRF